MARLGPYRCTGSIDVRYWIAILWFIATARGIHDNDPRGRRKLEWQKFDSRSAPGKAKSVQAKRKTQLLVILFNFTEVERRICPYDERVVLGRMSELVQFCSNWRRLDVTSGNLTQAPVCNS